MAAVADYIRENDCDSVYCLGELRERRVSAQQGVQFVFGNLARGNNIPVGAPVGGPTDMMGPVASPTGMANVGSYFAFNVLPTIIFFSALSTLLYHTGILPLIVQGMAWVMQKTMRTSGAETLSAANIFLGQTEAPLLVKPFIAGATNSDLIAIMVAGFANIASGVLTAYVGMLHGFFPDSAGHLLAASLISAPASLVVAKLLLPEAGTPETAGVVIITAYALCGFANFSNIALQIGGISGMASTRRHDLSRGSDRVCGNRLVPTAAADTGAAGAGAVCLQLRRAPPPPGNGSGSECGNDVHCDHLQPLYFSSFLGYRTSEAGRARVY